MYCWMFSQISRDQEWDMSTGPAGHVVVKQRPFSHCPLATMGYELPATNSQARNVNPKNQCLQYVHLHLDVWLTIPHKTIEIIISGFWWPGKTMVKTQNSKSAFLTTSRLSATTCDKRTSGPKDQKKKTPSSLMAQWERGRLARDLSNLEIKPVNFIQWMFMVPPKGGR